MSQNSNLPMVDLINDTANPEGSRLTTILTEKPVVSFTTEQVIVGEGNKFAWNFSLDQPVPEGGLTLNLPVTQNNDPAPGDVIYNIEGSSGIADFTFLTEDGVSLGFSVTLAEGVTEATLVSEAVADDIEEIDEIATVALADGEDYKANPDSNQVNIIITEQPVVSFTPSEVSVAEGDTFVWNFSLDKPVPEGGLTLNLPVTQNNDPAPGDVIYNVEGSSGISDFNFLVQDDVSLGFRITLAEGVTEATLVSEAVADDIEEIDEIATIVLADGEDYRANPQSNEVVLTIVEQDSQAIPTVSFTTEQVIVGEGNKFAWNFSLDQPVPEGGLTLNLPVTQNNDPAPGDVIYNVEGSSGIADFTFLTEDGVSLGFSVTLAEGVTEAKLVSQAVADDIEEIDEIATIVLADGEDYRANPQSQSVVLTILENSLPIVSVTAEPTIFAEDGGMGSFIFTLSQPAPEEGLKIKFEAFDEDGMQGDSEVALENISDIEIITEGNNPTSFIIVEPGATQAKVMFTGIPDGVPEGEEIAAFSLLEGDGYTIDSNQNSANIIITDLPIVSLDTDKTVISEGGEPQIITINLSEPAPTGGLVIKSRLDDPDGEPGDTDSALEFFSNITDLVETEEDGVFFNDITIQEGATTATIGIKAVTDNKVEGTETISITLLEGENYSIDPAFSKITTTIEDTLSKEISGTPGDDNLSGTNAAEKISGGRGDDNIFANGGMDSLIGGRGDDNIYGTDAAEKISGGRGDDIIYANGGADLINSGAGLDTVFLGTGAATVVLEIGEGFDTIYNFQLGATKFEVSSLDNLTFDDSNLGAKIFQEDDLIAVVAGESANTFSSDKDTIFAV